MEKNLFTAILLSIVTLIVFQSFFAPKHTQQPVNQTISATQQTALPDTANPQINEAAMPDVNVSLNQRYRDLASTGQSKQITGQNDFVRYAFDTRDGVIAEFSIIRIPVKGELSEEKSLFTRLAPPACPGYLDGLDDGSLYELTESDGSRYVFEKKEDGRSIQKVYTVHDKFNVDLELLFINDTDEPWSIPEGLWVSTGGLFPSKSKYSRRDFGMINLLNDKDIKKANQKKAQNPLYGNITWAGVKDRFFAAVVIPLSGGSASVGRKYAAMDDPSETALCGYVKIPPLSVAPGGISSVLMGYYLGPKHYETLKEAGSNLDRLMDLGIFGFIGKIVLWLLNTIFAYVHNYGIAILLVTFIIKLCLYPLTKKSYNSMKKMQALQPKIQALKEQYKDNQQKMQEELMKMYKTEHINPFGGCVPIFFQIPVFFALFTVLRTSIELQGASFLWIKDLAAPDTVAHIGSLALNPLPIIMAASFFLQQKLTNTGAGQTQQQKIMLYMMPGMFLFFMYSAPAGLTLYWTTNTVLSIGEMSLKKS